MPSELGLPSGPRQYLTSEFPTVRKYWAEGVRVALKLYDKSNRNVFNVCSGAAPFTGEPSIVAASRIRMACAVRWSRLSEQIFRVDKWSPAVVRLPSGR